MKKPTKPTHLKLVEQADDPELEAARAFFRAQTGKQGRPPSTRPVPLAPKPRRQRRPTFFMMDHDLLTALGRSANCPLLILISELDRLVFKAGKNPVRLTNAMLRQLGLTRSKKSRNLKLLQKIGAIEITRQGRQAPWVTWNNPARPPV